ncbi:MAG TPA: cation:proton antiporter [Candidatus Acidoferrales bacterium]|nr:cation:proton antiporter [Candidatus Acidoferrales bacterium]
MFDSALFLLQIAVIVGFSCLVASAIRRLGQPQVIGEMAAGIALGPTLFGLSAPFAYHSLFPPASLGYLNALSQAGLVIFIFLVGVRVDFAELRRQSGVAVVISNISVIIPLLMGIALAQYLFPRYGNGDRVAFALFVGTAMSVTAFPVLARILMERNLLDTRLGSVAITCAAVDDITAWILLAAIVALTRHDQNPRPLWVMFVYLTIYVAMVLILGRVLFAWSKRVEEGKLPLNAMLIFVILAFISGAAGEWIGIHSFVGAFFAGLVIPRKFRQEMIDKLEGLTLLLLIPIFFALTGIRTNLLFKIGSGAYLDLLLILLVAIASKWGGASIGARAKGMGWRDACQLGLMMNTRGLVELIVLNVGLDRGILSPTLFSMMVCMALVTTFMAMPLMDWVGREKLKAAAAA